MQSIAFCYVVSITLAFAARSSNGNELGAQEVDKCVDELRASRSNAETAIVLRDLRDGGPQVSEAIPTIIEIIGNDRQNRYLRKLAIEVIDAHADASAAAIPTLIAITETEDDDLAAQAAITLSTIGQPSDEVGNILSAALTRSSSGRRLRIEAARSLGLLRPQAREVVSSLTTALSRAKGDPELQATIVTALSHFGADAREAVEILTDLLRDSKTPDDLAHHIADALASIAAQAEKRTPGFGMFDCAAWLFTLQNARDVLRSGRLRDVDGAIAAHDSAIAAIWNRLRKWDVAGLLIYVLVSFANNVMSLAKRGWLTLNLKELESIKGPNLWVADLTNVRLGRLITPILVILIVPTLRILLIDVRFMVCVMLMICSKYFKHNVASTEPRKNASTNKRRQVNEQNRNIV